jgi:hypothetical protein
VLVLRRPRRHQQHQHHEGQCGPHQFCSFR